jgi:hypothetical protein
MLFTKIRKLIKKYDTKWDSSVNTNIFLSYFFLTLPHLFISFLLILFFPEKWIGILILAILLPDFSHAFNLMLRIKFNKIFLFFNNQFTMSNIPKINGVLLISTIIILFIIQEYVLVLAGISHLILDWIGF